MNLPYAWLADFLPELPPADELAELLASIGLGVERVYTRPGAPEGVIVARVDEVTLVPGSDHLLLATVTDGAKSWRVVTGAPNTKPGLVTALALPGAHLAGGLAVEARELAGVRSEGVLCSPAELGLYDYAGGLIELGDDAELGASLAALWPGDTILELELTPNRADAFSLLGVARDVAAKLGTPYRHPAAELPLGHEGADTGLRIEVEDRAACPRFTLRLVEGVQVKPSPLWLQRRLAAVGLRPRNNVVDVTNYVTFELGQPSHAYDRADLTDGTILVRWAQERESLVALDEERYQFSSQDLLITTPDPSGVTKPIGVAGVIGGLHHSVKKATQAIALEVAHFEPVTVRKTAKRLGLSTEASYRFERGVDPDLPPLAAARAASLIAELGGGRLHPGLTQAGGDAPVRTVSFRPSRVRFLMAMEVPLDEQRRFLERLGCAVEERGEDDWTVTVPSWRFDLAIEEDLIEEVARLHGYDAIPATLPAMSFVPEATDVLSRGLRHLLVGFGLQETITYTFSSDGELARARAPEAAVRLQAPPSAERSVLRTALYPGLLGAARVNQALPALALFEIGRVFTDEGEAEWLALLLRGDWVQGGWLPGQRTDFFVLKGLLEKLAASYGAGLELEPCAFAQLHPGISAEVRWNGAKVGWAGKLHPRVAAHFELGDVFLAELALPLAAGEVAFTDFSRQPFAERDLAVITPQSVSYASLAALIRGAAGEHLETLAPFDVYQGPPIAESARSVALRLRFRHPVRALTGEEVDAAVAGVVGALRAAGYSLREGA